jgi:hypothetical protein
MSPAEFRRLALALPGVTERSHMGHPDFRVAGKIFATLGYPDDRFGTVMVSPQEQDYLVRRHAFTPAAGAWGRSGSTSVKLAAASRRAVTLALESAWSRRAPKKLRSQYETAGPTAQRLHGL